MEEMIMAAEKLFLPAPPIEEVEAGDAEPQYVGVWCWTEDDDSGEWVPRESHGFLLPGGAALKIYAQEGKRPEVRYFAPGKWQWGTLPSAGSGAGRHIEPKLRKERPCGIK